MRGVIDPELGDNVVDLGMVRSTQIGEGGDVDVTLALTTAGCPLRAQLMKDVRPGWAASPGVTKVRVRFSEMDKEEKAACMAKARWKARENAPDTEISATTRVVAIASGKGGVGKSSVTVNLAVGAGRSRPGVHGGRARRRHRRLLDPPHAGARRQGGRPRRAEDRPAPEGRSATAS